MKYRTMALTLLSAVALCFCAACTPEAANPPGSDNLVESNVPVEYDFSGLVIDEYTVSLTGFEGLPWSYQLPQELVEATGGGQLIALKNSGVQFAGLDFQSEHLFNYTVSVPDLGEDERVLTSGQFVRFGYTDLNARDPQPELAASDFNQVMAYLTQLYGQPTHYVLSYTGSDQNTEALTAPLTAAQLSSEDIRGCEAFWSDLESVTVSLRLDTSYGGTLSVIFAKTA